MTTNEPATSDRPRAFDGDDPPSVLVPLRVVEGESIPEGVVDLLSGANVVLLGYHELPEQTPPGQARMEYEESATRALEDFAGAFREHGATVDVHLAFTHDADQTIDRIAREEGCLAILVPNPVVEMTDLLVAVRGIVDVARIARVAGPIAAASHLDVTILHVQPPDADLDDVQTTALLERTRDALTEYGVSTNRIETRTEVADRPILAIADVAGEFDAVVIGESEPTLLNRLFGPASERVADRFLGPVLVVRRKQNADQDDDATEESEGK